MKLGLFVEGLSDLRTFPILIEKIFKGKSGKPAVIVRTIPQGDMLNSDKMEAYLKKDLIANHRDLRKILVCLDCECTPPEQKMKLVLPVEKKLKAEFPRVQINYCLVVHALEGWLASDEQALAEYLGQRHLKLDWDAEKTCKPKEALKETFKRARKSFDHIKDDPNIARKIDPDTLARRNRSFSNFRKMIGVSKG